MRFTKPAWVMHKDPSPKSDANAAKRVSIFSVHVHPDGSRIATGGLDAKIRIWSTKPILNPAAEAANRPPKSLCTLTMHTGPVLTVRWAHSGRWLASGSDDEIVMVWDLDPNARGRAWGSDEANVEGWKALKRLPGHESDVTDVAWAPEDRYLASVALDSKVIVWCGYTLERLRKLDLHQGFVKGVCWDPVGEFLATQSDDRTVKIWRTKDWSLEATVDKPFVDSPGSTFFRRLSWSPDGAHITASNATNNKGMVFIAAVITRNTWGSEISLVGHENTVEVAAYNPHIFLRDPSVSMQAAQTANICSVVALGADDRSVSIWQTKSARPLIVAREVFERQIMDLSWSWDGLTLYACSSDGTIAVFDFDAEELEGIAPHSVREHYLANKFDFVPQPVPAGYSHRRPSEVHPHNANRTTPPPSPPPQDYPHPQQMNGFGSGSGSGNAEKINVLVAKRGPKRRHNAHQQQIPSASNPTTNSSRSNMSMTMNLPNRSSMSRNTSHESGGGYSGIKNLQLNSDSQSQSPAPFDANDGYNNVHIDRRRSTGNALTRAQENVSVHEIHVAGSSRQASSDLNANATSIGRRPLLTFVTTSVGLLGEDVLEAKNSEGDGSHEIRFINRGKTQWLDYIPSPALALIATTRYCAVTMLDGTVNVYSHKGRRITPTITLGSPCFVMEGESNALLIITSSGQVFCWNIAKNAAFFPPTSVLAILAPNHALTTANVLATGTPILTCSNGAVYSYDANLICWVKLSDRWWANGSEVWQGKIRDQNNNYPSRGVLATIEASIPVPEPTAVEVAAAADRPQWWATALTLGHLESRLHATRLLDSPGEYKNTMALYAKKIAEADLGDKADELAKELFGPVYWKPGRGEDGWVSTIVGIPKRELLKEVLVIFAKSTALAKLASEWQRTLEKANSDDL